MASHELFLLLLSRRRDRLSVLRVVFLSCAGCPSFDTLGVVSFSLSCCVCVCVHRLRICKLAKVVPIPSGKAKAELASFPNSRQGHHHRTIKGKEEEKDECPVGRVVWKGDHQLRRRS